MGCFRLFRQCRCRNLLWFLSSPQSFTARSNRRSAVRITSRQLHPRFISRGISAPESLLVCKRLYRSAYYLRFEITRRETFLVIRQSNEQTAADPAFDDWSKDEFHCVTLVDVLSDGLLLIVFPAQDDMRGWMRTVWIY